MNKYTVTVVRKEWLDFEVSAESEEEAMAKAEELAYDTNWNAENPDAAYEIDYVQMMEEL